MAKPVKETKQIGTVHLGGGLDEQQAVRDAMADARVDECVKSGDFLHIYGWDTETEANTARENRAENEIEAMEAAEEDAKKAAEAEAKSHESENS